VNTLPDAARILAPPDDQSAASARWRLALATAVFLLLPITPARAATILFVGNSFTAGGRASVPEIFDRLAQAGGHPNPETAMRTQGGADFKFHADDPTTLQAIASRPWDFVVLQNFSTEPTHFTADGHRVENHFTYGSILYERILANHPGTKVVLFETWSRAAVHPYITGSSGPNSFASTAEMQGELRANYHALARNLTAGHPGKPPVSVAPIGTAWEMAGALAGSTDPDFVDLHGTDDYHADDDGDYLSAAVLYSKIYGVSPAGLSRDPLISELGLQRNVSASYLEDIAWQAALAAPEPGTAISAFVGASLLLSSRRRRG